MANMYVYLPSIYKAFPLQTPRHIRLIQMKEASDADDPIEFSFLTTNLDEPDMYQTLSYTWGETFADGSHLTHCAYCDGRLVRITSNLDDFLRRFRARLVNGDMTSDLPLWIDALCINQKDSKERGEQVAIMSSIYQSATHLIIWLGEFDIPQSLKNPFNAIDHLPTPEDLEIKPNSPEWQMLKKIIQLPWFSRRWIIQEVLYTSQDDTTIWLGEHQSSWTSFTQVLEAAHITYLAGPPIRLVQDGVFSIENKANNDRSLLHNLRLCQDAECGDPRDRVFALLSISYDGDDFVVNYESDTEAVYRQVAECIVPSGKTDHLLLMLACATACSRGDSETNMPSWVPDWRNRLVCRTRLQEDCLNACFARDMATSLFYHQRSLEVIDRRYLCLQGWLIPCCECDAGCTCSSCKICVLDAEASQVINTLTAQQAGGLTNLDKGSRKVSRPRNAYQAFRDIEILKERPWTSLERGQTLCLLPGPDIAFVLSLQGQMTYGNDPLYRLDSCFLVTTWSMETWFENVVGDSGRVLIT